MKPIFQIIFFVSIFLSFSVKAATITSTVGGGPWSAAGTWIGGTAPGPGDIAVINNNSIVTLDNNITINGLTFTSGANTSTLNLAGFTLNVNGVITINQPTAAVNKTLNVGAGILNATTLNMTATTADNRDCIVSISTGTVNISGNISMPSVFARHHIDFTGNGTLNVGGNVTTAGGFTPFAGCTVHYNGAGNQTCGGAYNYANVIFSGGGTKTVGGATTAFGDVTIRNNIDVTFSSTLSVTASSDVIVEDQSTLIFTGAATLSGDLIVQDPSNVTFTTNSTIGGVLDVQSASTFNFNGTIGVTGLSSFTGNTTLNCVGAATLTGGLTLNSPTTAIFSANSTIGSHFNVLSTSTVDFNGTISIAGNTTLQGATILNTASTATFLGDLNLLNTSRLIPAALTRVQVGGNWNNSSTDPDSFVEGTSRVELIGTSGTQILTNTLNGIENFYMLLINNTSPAKPALVSAIDIFVSEDYDHSNGFLDLLGNNFTTNGAAVSAQTFSLSGGGLISTVAGSQVNLISSASNILTVTIANFSIGETSSEEIIITLTSENSSFANSIFYGPMVATKTGNANNDTPGGNIFYGPIEFNTIVGGDRWRMANSNPDIFHNLTVNHNGAGNFILGRQTTGNQYYGTTTLNSSTAGGLYIGRNNVAAGTFTNEFFGPVVVNVTLNGNVNFAESDATRIHHCIFNDVVTLNSSPTSTGDIRFGSISFGTTTFQNNGTIATGVIDGATTITLLNVTQSSNVPFTINCTGNGNITCGNNTATSLVSLNGVVSFSAPTVSIRQSTFNNDVTITSTGTTTCGDAVMPTLNFFNADLTINTAILLLRQNQMNGLSTISAQSFLFQTNVFNGIANMIKTNGATSNTTNGDNVFNNDVTFTHNGTGQWSLGSSPAGDDYNGNVTYLRMNAGTLSMASTNTSTFAGNISTVGSSSNPLIATVGGGIAVLDGNANQIISGDIARAPLFGNLRLNKTGGSVTLAVPINISTDINFISGIMNTDATNLLIVNNGATRTGGSDASHVNGPMRKVGTNAFEFPVGKGGFWRPISISNPSVSTDHFTAEFFNSSPDAIDLVDPAPMDAPIENISDCEFWILDRTNGFSNVSVTLSYRPYGSNGCSGVTDLANLTIARWDGTTWRNHPSTGVGVPSGSITTDVPVSSFSPFALATFSSTNPLPIELINFKVIPTSSSVLLQWQTASEINNDYFEIERSVDGEHFQSIEKVEGAGNSTQLLNYSTIDNNPIIGISYYRLKQTDFDGAFAYSDVKQVKFSSVDLIRVYPNPAKDEVFIRFNDISNFTQIIISDVTGKRIKMENCSEKELVTVPLNNLTSGVYFITFKGEGNDVTCKLIVE